MNLWLVVGAIGCGIFVFLTCLLWMRTKSWTAKVVLLLFALASIGATASLAARLPFPLYRYYANAEEALAIDWEGVKKICAELFDTVLTLHPGTGALWIKKHAVTQDHLLSMRVELDRERNALILRTQPELPQKYGGFRLSLAVPVEIEELQVQERGDYATVKIYGLNLINIVAAGASVTMVGGKVRSIQTSDASLDLVRVEVLEVVATVSWIELTDPVVPPEGTVVTLGKGLVTLRAQAPLHLILETGPEVAVSLPAGVAYSVEELGVGKRWEVGPAELPPITIRMKGGKFRWISP